MKSMEDLIEESGLDVVEWDYKRLCESIRQIEKWESDLASSGRIPADFDPKTGAETIKEELAAAREEAKTWRDYVLAKRKSVDVSGSVKVPVVKTTDESDVGL